MKAITVIVNFAVLGQGVLRLSYLPYELFYIAIDSIESNPLPRLSVPPSMWHPFIEMVR